MIATLLRRVVPRRFRPSGHLEHLVRTRTAGRVCSGPFTGMLYVDGAVRAAHLPKLLGTYERELNHYIEEACALNFSLIVDIGAAEGYYAVGMAVRNPQARVIAFEMQATERSVLAEAVSLNAVVNRLEIRGKCESEDLERVLGDTPRPFVICDAEGYESVLLDPAIVPSLRLATILVELHEFVEKGVSEKIRQRFTASHKVIQIWQEERTISDFPFRDFYTRWLPKPYLRWAVNESRPERMSWFWMEPVATDHGPRDD